MTWYTGSGGIVPSGSYTIPQNALSGKELGIAPLWTRVANMGGVLNYEKGTSAYLRWNFVGRALPLMTTETDPGDHAPFNNVGLVLPWPTGTLPRG
jgi:hypothetical protein